jgi:uncharacterized delta-60 repeat protein
MVQRLTPRRIGALREAGGGAFRLLAVLSAVLVWPGSVLAASGDLDASYGQGGAAVADFGLVAGGTVNDNASGNALVVQPDGKVIVVGTGIDQFGATTDIVSARFTTAGGLDAAWGTAGKGQFDFGESETGYGAVLQPDGKLLIGGDSTDRVTGAGDVLAARINTDGTPDATFGTGGAAHPDFGGSEFGRGIALTRDGKIVIVGYTSSSREVTVRLNNPQGTPDTSFGTGGSLEEFPPGVAVAISAVALGPDGSIYTARTASDPPEPDDFWVEDDVTGAPGFVARDDLGGEDVASAIALQSDGKTLVAGTTNAKAADDFAVERYSVGGIRDAAFGVGGRVIVDAGASDAAHAMALQPDGKIIVAGTTTAGSGATATSKIAVMRFQPNGQLDTTFGNAGISVVGIAGAKLQGNAVGLQANGDIVVGGTITPAGSTRKQLLAVRLHGDATGTAATGSGGTTAGGDNGKSGGTTTVGASSTKSAPPLCMGKPATIVGTAGADHLKGTAKADVIVALGGNDTIDGGGGNDVICAGAGNDHVSGGAGNDRIDGQAGADVISGGAGKDTLDGGAGNDVLSGGAGADTLTGDAGADTLAGGAGADKLSGGAGNDRLTGGAGTDTLTGGVGKNVKTQ